MERLATAINRATNNNTVINLFLVGCFGALGARSAKQQEEIQSLQAEKEGLAQSNRTIKNIIWKSKQQLYAAATSENGAAAVPPLSTLKAIYGEAAASSVSSSVDAKKGDENSAASRIMV